MSKMKTLVCVMSAYTLMLFTCVGAYDVMSTIGKVIKDKNI